ncbi:hypothetical protein [Paenibacillus sp. Soil724D2]|uniref:hypothetical protein n=1 Tax=Paenibacillus sp. (strain Soil724D2) TaxID=1736392 RepID=UPI0007131323|nr:hypothetical protein [Paenibacillus sp. Soil724D2]KRE33283.1 hypothetical protein ASG85_13460 [Paenibacillus sp. Soil724D2]
MSIDIKKLLYSYHKLQVGLANIKESIRREQLKRQYPSCTPAYNDDIKGRGGLAVSQTERFALLNVELDDNTRFMQWDAEEHEYVIRLIESALATLNEKQQQLIKLAYFEGREPIQAHGMMNISLSHYYHVHTTALNGIVQCLNGGNVFMNRLIPTRKQGKMSKKQGNMAVLV